MVGWPVGRSVSQLGVSPSCWQIQITEMMTTTSHQLIDIQQQTTDQLYQRTNKSFAMRDLR